MALHSSNHFAINLTADISLDEKTIQFQSKFHFKLYHLYFLKHVSNDSQTKLSLTLRHENVIVYDIVPNKELFHVKEPIAWPIKWNNMAAVWSWGTENWKKVSQV